MNEGEVHGVAQYAVAVHIATPDDGSSQEETQGDMRGGVVDLGSPQPVCVCALKQSGFWLPPQAKSQQFVVLPFLHIYSDHLQWEPHQLGSPVYYQASQ